jgi:caffeoyl-CoA O-methyltransferase
MPSILDATTEAYINSMQPSVDPLVEQMEEYARENDVPIASRDVATFQTILGRAMGADRILEIGTAIGYTTIQLARTGANVVTLELDPERADVARDYIDQSDVEDRIDLLEGDAVELLPTLDESFDIAFIDGPTDEYAAYLDRVIPLLRPEGLIVIDNLLRRGHVPAAADAGDVEDSSIDALVEFNQQLRDHDDVEALVLPLDDGTGFALKH